MSADDARTWLADEGVTQVGAGHWVEVTPDGTTTYTTNELVHEWAQAMLADPDVDAAAQLALGLDGWRRPRTVRRSPTRCGSNGSRISGRCRPRSTPSSEVSGPVPWEVKRDVYDAVATSHPCARS
jgi:hypothetical protein